MLSYGGPVADARVREFWVLSARGILGYGFRETSLAAGAQRYPARVYGMRAEDVLFTVYDAALALLGLAIPL